MRLNIVVGSSDVAYKYSGFRPKRKDEDFFEKDVNSGSGGAGGSKEGNKQSGNYKDSGKPGSGGGGGRRGGRSGYNDRRGNYNNKKNEDKKPEENNAEGETGSTPVVSKPIKITGYIPGAELEEDVKPSIKNNTTPVPSNPDNSKDSIKEPSPEIPKQQEAVDIEIQQDLETETINPIEQDEIALPATTVEPQKNSKQIQQHHQPLKTQEIVQNNNIKEVPKDVEQHHENGSISTQVKSYTFNLSTPLGPEITSGEQTFIEINGSLYLKLTPPSNDAAGAEDTEETVPSKPEWYTSLEEDFHKAKNPPPKKPAGKNNPKKNQHHHPEVQPELKNGKLVYPVKVPDYILQDLNIKPDFKKQQQQQQQNNNPQKKKNNY